MPALSVAGLICLVAGCGPGNQAVPDQDDPGRKIVEESLRLHEARVKEHLIGHDHRGFPVYGVDEEGQPVYTRDKE